MGEGDGDVCGPDFSSWGPGVEHGEEGFFAGGPEGGFFEGSFGEDLWGVMVVIIIDDWEKTSMRVFFSLLVLTKSRGLCGFMSCETRLISLLMASVVPENFRKRVGSSSHSVCH